MSRGQKKPLWRKVNRRTYKVHREDLHGEARDMRAAGGEESMHSTRRQGRDYTPLYKFLLSKVGENWDAVHAEAVSRLDDSAPIFYMVALKEADRRPVMRSGESTYYSGLYVDAAGRLAVVDPGINHTTFEPFCACCTHTFNGKPLVKAYTGPRSLGASDGEPGDFEP
ncbi:hypothetical protein [Aliiroseovarius sp.]|uniref:hypothetical protein n=1 Tax=Aliiroseovarius sp. TaxID=1872442 RepID=UPI003BAB7463